MKDRARAMLFLFVVASLLMVSALLTPLLAASFEHPGVLPSNPFYFFKEWSRDIKRALVFSDVQRLELELEILDEKAAELGKLLELAPGKIVIINAAVVNYNQSAQKIVTTDQVISEELLNKIIFYTTRHNQLFSYLSDQNKKPLNVQVFLIEKLAAARPIRLQIRSMIFSLSDGSQQLFPTLRWAEAIDALESQVPADKKYELLRLKEELLLDFATELQAKNIPEELSAALRGSLISRLRVLDELRFKINDSESKSRLSLMRQSVLTQLEKDHLINEVIVNAVIGEARALFQALKTSYLSGTEKRGDQIKFYLEQANVSLAQGQLNTALGQASLALAAIKNTLLEQLSDKASYGNELNLLKADFDQLSAASGKENKNLLSSVERQIISLSGKTVTSKDLIRIRLLLGEAKYNKN